MLIAIFINKFVHYLLIQLILICRFFFIRLAYWIVFIQCIKTAHINKKNKKSINEKKKNDNFPSWISQTFNWKNSLSINKENMKCYCVIE